MVVASGGVPCLPEISGIDSPIVHTVPKLYSRLKSLLNFFSPRPSRRSRHVWIPIGKRVVILGSGLHAMEVAEFLIKAGKKVTILSAEPALADDRWSNLMNIRMQNWLAQKDTVVHTGVNIERIVPNGVEITTNDGARMTIEADAVIPTTNLMADTSIAESLEGKVKEVYCVGDCKQDGLIMNAIRDGYSVARAL